MAACGGRRAVDGWRRLTTRLAAACVLFAGHAESGTNQWTFTGPPGGNVASVAFHPEDDDTALLGSARGVHLTLDDGASWSRVFEGDMNDMSTVLFDPTDSQRVFAIGNGLFRSTDGGQTFGPSIAPADNMRWMSIADDGVLYAMNVFGRLFRTPDGGSPWTEIIVPWDRVILTAALAVDPSDSDTLYVAVAKAGVYRSTDGGATWEPPVPGSPGGRNEFDAVAYLAVDPANGSRVLAATGDGIQRSQDGGAGWSTALAGMSFAWVGFEPTDTDSVFAITVTGQIVRSVDGASSWPAELRPARLPVGLVHGAALSAVTAGRMLVATSEGPMYSDNAGVYFTRRTTGFSAGTPASLSVADDGRVYAAMRFPAGLFYRNGTTWSPPLSAPLIENVPGAASLRAVAVAPSDSNRVYAIDLANRLLRSTDGGRNWTGPHPKFFPGNEAFSALAVNPVDPMVVYVAGMVTLWHSTDGGGTWVATGAGLPVPVRQLVISPDPAVLYAIAHTTPSTTSVFVSTDFGATFAEAEELPGDFIMSLTAHPADPDTVFAVLDSALARSSDRGASWTITEEFGLTGDAYLIGSQLLIDPVHPDTWFLLSSQFDRGFLRTVDGGAHWQSTAFRPGGVESPFGTAVLNPQRPGMVIGGTLDGGLAEYEVSPDLAVSITGPGNGVVAGGTATAKVSVRNEGPHAASAAHLSIAVTGVLSAAAPEGCELVSGRYECDLGAMQVGQARTLDLAFTVSGAIAAGTVTATVTGHEPDAIVSNNEAVAVTMSAEHSDVGVTLSAVPTVTTGGATNFVATVSNGGPHASPDTYLQVEFPVGTFALTAVPSQGSCVQVGTAPMTWNCELGTVNVGSSVTLALGVRGDVAATHTLEAAVASGNLDVATANDVAMAHFIVQAPPTPQSGGGGGGGGGGGRFDWLALLLLAAVAWGRRNFAVYAPERVSQPRRNPSVA